MERTVFQRTRGYTGIRATRTNRKKSGYPGVPDVVALEIIKMGRSIGEGTFNSSSVGSEGLPALIGDWSSILSYKAEWVLEH